MTVEGRVTIDHRLGGDGALLRRHERSAELGDQLLTPPTLARLRSADPPGLRAGGIMRSGGLCPVQSQGFFRAGG